MERFGEFVGFIRSGGPVNYVIAGLCLFVIAVFSERIIYFSAPAIKKTVEGGFAKFQPARFYGPNSESFVMDFLYYYEGGE
jgi:hypothetical protein